MKKDENLLADEGIYLTILSKKKKDNAMLSLNGLVYNDVGCIDLF